MDPRHLELAADFCKIAGKQNLVEYLGLESGCTADEALEQLKKRRRYMQGMQSNPKYKNEALHLIKNYSTYEKLLADPAAYLVEARRKAEKQHLPVVEMTIRGALRGGAPSREQLDFLRRNAMELGVGEDTFTGTLEKLLREAGINSAPALERAKPTPVTVANSADDLGGSSRLLRPGGTAQPLGNDLIDEVDFTDYYAALGLGRGSSQAEIHEAYNERLRHAKTLPRDDMNAAIRRLEASWSILGDPTSRETYDLSRRSTGPPARDRETTDPSGFRPSPLAAPTAPPVRQRSHTPKAKGGEEYTPTGGGMPAAVPARPHHAPTVLEIEGDPVRQVKIASAPANSLVHVHLEGDGTASARVSTDQPWLVAQPSRLEPGLIHYVVTVRIDPRAMRSRHSEGTVTIQTDRGDRAMVRFEVERTTSVLPYVAGALALLLVLIVTVIVAWFTVSAAFGAT